jgi:hypothetical protein
MSWRAVSSATTWTGRSEACVGLVVDVADDLLDQVLQGDDASGAAVLVDDDGEVHPLGPHLGHGDEHRLVLGAWRGPGA